ncbi:MAG: SurA N-terminal domain-containing protein [Bdellovibrionales bacterium]|nr:SurA N-terminal domain-containing protein [Bdellovibrionales bacterium]
MSEFTKNKSAGVFATVLIGFIILTFMFTGYQQFENGGGGATSIGSVGGDSIKPEEYDQEYKRQIEFYKQISGGAELTSKQLEAFKVKESVIRNIVQRKLMVKFAKDLGTFPADEEIKTEIKALPYFQTNGQFDITRYKGLLAANSLTPHEFEQDVINQIRTRKAQELAATYPLSKGYMADLAKFREDKVNAEIVQISKSSLSQFVEVSSDEVTKFLNVETNQKRVESIFKERQASLDKPAEVTARHILLMTQGKNEADVKTQIEKIAKEATASNFATLANKYTEDPSGKGKGGELGAFGKGQMVPEFDAVAFSQKPGVVSAPVKTAYGYHLILVEKRTEPIVAKLADFKEKFSREIIQKDKVEDLKKITIDLANGMRKALEAGNETEVKALTAKYKLQYQKTSMNRIDGVDAGTYLSAENMKTIFAADLTKPQFHSFDDGGNLIMLRTTPGAVVADANVETKAQADQTSLKNALARKMMDSILKEMEANTRVKINHNMLRM